MCICRHYRNVHISPNQVNTEAFMGHSKNFEANVITKWPKNHISLIHFNIIFPDFEGLRTHYSGKMTTNMSKRP